MEKEKRKQGAELDFGVWKAQMDQEPEEKLIKKIEENEIEEAEGTDINQDPKAKIIRELLPYLEPVEFLKRGGFGAVYKCRSDTNDGFHAVKVIEINEKNPLKQVKDAISIQQRYQDQSIVKIYNTRDYSYTDRFDVIRSFVVIDMDYMEGSLQDLIEKQGKLHPVQAVNIAFNLCKVLVEMEKRQDTHNDIKPANILYKTIRNEKIFYLGDFGSAINRYERTGDTEPDSTPNYCPTGGELSDIYSLGIVLMVSLGNGIPTYDEKRNNTFRFTDTDAELQRICRKACNSDKNIRYKYARDLLSDLKSWRNSHSDEVNLFSECGPDLFRIAENMIKEDESSETMNGYRELTIQYLETVIQKGNEPGLDKALKQRSIDAMHSAMYHLYCIYKKTEKQMVEMRCIDREKAIGYLETAANANISAAMNSYVCHMIRKEKRVDPKWIKMLREAARDWTPAQYNLALLIRTGLAEPVTENEDAELLEKAVKAQYAPACKLKEKVHQRADD